MVRRRKIYLTDALKMSLMFGLFQGIMPIIGWASGVNFIDLISAWDHWIAFGLLGAIGGKMIYDDLTFGDEEGVDEYSISIFQLLMLAVATSIDALAVGFGLIILESICFRF